jgi:hypothetical protein
MTMMNVTNAERAHLREKLERPTEYKIQNSRETTMVFEMIGVVSEDELFLDQPVRNTARLTNSVDSRDISPVILEEAHDVKQDVEGQRPYWREGDVHRGLYKLVPRRLYRLVPSAHVCRIYDSDFTNLKWPNHDGWCSAGNAMKLVYLL